MEGGDDHQRDLHREKDGDDDGKTVIFGLLTSQVVSMDPFVQNIGNNISYVAKVIFLSTLP